MSAQLVNLSETVRDMRNEVCICRISPDDAEQLRNMLQELIRDLMSLKHETILFDNMPSDDDENTIIQIDDTSETIDESDSDAFSVTTAHIEIIQEQMAEPTRSLLSAMSSMIRCCDNVLMRTLGAPNLIEDFEETDAAQSLQDLQRAIREYDIADEAVIKHPELPTLYTSNPVLVEMFLFMQPIRQAANTVNNLANKVLEIHGKPKSGRKRLFLPSFPLSKAIRRMNPQVQHDRGGGSATLYYKIKEEIDTIMDKVHAKAYVIHPEQAGDERLTKNTAAAGFMTADGDSVRFRTWQVLHRLQQFEARFALKVVFVMTPLCVPAWLHESRDWWYEYDCWWALVAAWFMMHPRVGGNATDLVSRTVATITGAVWAALIYWAGEASGRGLPYVLAVGAVIFMVPACRYTIPEKVEMLT